MTEIEIDASAATGSAAAPPAHRSAFTPRALLLLGILCSIVGIPFSFALLGILSSPPRLPLSPDTAGTLSMTVMGLACLIGAALCFRRARNGYRRGYVSLLSYRKQLAAAAAATMTFLLLSLISVLARDYSTLPVLLLNPLLLMAWVGVSLKRGEACRLRTAAAGGKTVAEKPDAAHWWTHYGTRQENGEPRTGDRIANGRR